MQQNLRWVQSVWRITCNKALDGLFCSRNEMRMTPDFDKIKQRTPGSTNSVALIPIEGIRITYFEHLLYSDSCGLYLLAVDTFYHNGENWGLLHPLYRQSMNHFRLRVHPARNSVSYLE